MRDYYKGREMNEIDFNVHHFWKEKWMSCDETMLIDNPWSLAHPPDAHANLYSCKSVIELKMQPVHTILKIIAL